MKKYLSIIALALFFSGNAYADDSYEAAFKKAIDNHQYYFKYKGKNYTTDTKDKRFDFFDHGYKDFRSAAKYMVENYPDDKSTRCFIFKGKNWGFDRWKIKDSDKSFSVTNVADKSLGKLTIIKLKSIKNPYYIFVLIY